MHDLEHNASSSNVMKAAFPPAERAWAAVGRAAHRPALRAVRAIALLALLAVSIWLGAQVIQWTATVVQTCLGEVQHWVHGCRGAIAAMGGYGTY